MIKIAIEMHSDQNLIGMHFFYKNNNIKTIDEKVD